MSGVILVKLLAAIMAATVVVGLLLALLALINWCSARRARARKSESTSLMPTVSQSSAGPISLSLNGPESARRPKKGAWRRLVSFVRKNVFGQTPEGITVEVENAKLTVIAIKCPLCDWTIYSRARHDFRSCKCGAVSVDGGFDCMKCAWDQNRVPTPVAFELKVDATKKELYEDYNNYNDKFGAIPPVQRVAGDTDPARRK